MLFQLIRISVATQDEDCFCWIILSIGKLKTNIISALDMFSQAVATKYFGPENNFWSCKCGWKLSVIVMRRVDPNVSDNTGFSTKIALYNVTDGCTTNLWSNNSKTFLDSLNRTMSLLYENSPCSVLKTILKRCFWCLR